MAEMTRNSFEDITTRMDEIISAVRSKDTSLERSLDLFDEAISLGSHAVELVDSFDLSPSEAEQLEAAGASDASAQEASEPEDPDGAFGEAGADSSEHVD